MLDHIMTVNGSYVIIVKYFNESLPLKVTYGWYSMYIKIDKSVEESLPNETFRKNNIVGIDTNQTRHNGMSLSQRYGDALEQISELIDYYNSLR